MKRLDAEAVTASMLEVLNSLSLPAQNIVAQSYDGASTFVEVVSGVQTRRRSPSNCVGLHIHCCAHRLNLAAVGCISSLKKASELIKQLRLIYGFFSQSVVHAKLGETKELHGLSTSELKRHSDTRWCCQHASCKNARILPPATIDTLNHFAESDDPKDRERRGDSLGILGIIDTLWVFNLCMIEEVLRKCKSLHLLLQSPELDLNAAIVLIKATQGDVSEELDAIERGADTSSCDNVWQSFEALRDDLDLSAPRRRPVGRARRDAAADEAVVYDTPDDYRLKVYAPTLHAVVEELDQASRLPLQGLRAF
ncbi:hypothetical protein Pmar_PMAR003786 [Perkinsus marinus ATCC 50983]|uniref:DUF4371 domain-containing protein n=1 Tax=Perkinsus marinus (strain ATCC 50983 / TXsc) TaxID=423536 RepID=C5LV53_PERM5|nr:hypothetical protein Pmar_PMAR003786 [Perkinsus marinus ATCC 50983]EEQ99392.1 hypothetical protein Pmar_PMAR003786 [Perkinsus marinus ATCC 50983]|eukprot:XP_002766675.1 hypothetical protein Pmar_PMAR003786 [Perkinsus marinus ATCC 50983]